jgi:uncharacterized membrane protein
MLPNSAQSSRRSFFDILLCVALSIAILLRFININQRELWYDEVLSLLLSTGQKMQYVGPTDQVVTLSQYNALLHLPTLSFPLMLERLIRGLQGGEPHPPLFFLGHHLWLHGFGAGEIALRSLPLLWSLGAIAVAYGFGRSLLGHRAGLMFCTLLAVNPFYLFHSLNMRMYTPLVFWAILSAWALLEISRRDSDRLWERQGFLWQGCLIGAVAGGMLTFYLFAYWLIVLGALALWVDRKRAFYYALRIGAGIAITLPWMLWGTIKQLRNADIGRFSNAPAVMSPLFQHLQDALQTLGIHLVLGDWVSSVPVWAAPICGLGVLAAIVALGARLWRQDRHWFGIAAIMGLLPIVLALLVDSLTGKYTLGFGSGRTLIIMLPGCLLLITIALAGWKRKGQVAIALLLFGYLAIDVGDFSLRPRQVFHQIAQVIQESPNTPTLIVLNSQAWGHVNRLAYYISPEAKVSLLAQPAPKLADSFGPIVEKSYAQYGRVLVLESQTPLWSPPTTPEQRQKMVTSLASHFKLTAQRSLSGTMDLDRFELSVYQSNDRT